MSLMRLLRRLVAVTSAASLLTACTSGSTEPQAHTSKDAASTEGAFGYQVASLLVTTNSASAFGVASNAQALSGRLYPAAFLQGPDGQLVPNTDLLSAREVKPNADGLRQVYYTISDAAQFSDGEPVTCEDFLLAYVAGSMPSTFGSHMPLIDEIEDLQCGVGHKDFLIVLKRDQGDRWRYIFGPGTVLPAHVISRKLEISSKEMLDRLYSWDPSRVADIAQLWRYGFMLGEFDPKMQVSYGPYVIDHVEKSGEVVLVRNKNYYGDQAELDKLVLWPSYADSRHLADKGALRVGDFAGGVPSWTKAESLPVNYKVISQVGELTETLILSDKGLFADKGLRQAFAACVDQDAIARVSSQKSGMDVEPVLTHLLRHGDPIAKQLASVADPHRAVDPEQAAPLAGKTIRVGYLGPDERYAAMVDALRASCEPLGITIEDVPTEFMSATYLDTDPETGLPTIDAFLGAVDPLTEYPTVDARINRVEDLKRAEDELWKEVSAIPVAAQPRTFVVDSTLSNVVPYTGLAGIGWNLDRWTVDNENSPSSETRKVGS